MAGACIGAGAVAAAAAASERRGGWGRGDVLLQGPAVEEGPARDGVGGGVLRRGGAQSEPGRAHGHRGLRW